MHHDVDQLEQLWDIIPKAEKVHTAGDSELLGLLMEGCHITSILGKQSISDEESVHPGKFSERVQQHVLPAVAAT